MRTRKVSSPLGDDEVTPAESFAHEAKMSRALGINFVVTRRDRVRIVSVDTAAVDGPPLTPRIVNNARAILQRAYRDARRHERPRSHHSAPVRTVARSRERRPAAAVRRTRTATSRTAASSGDDGPGEPPPPRGGCHATASREAVVA